MKVMIDTNILIDIAARREQWFADSYKALLCTLGDTHNECLFSASAVTDVFYILRRLMHSRASAKDAIETLSEMVTITGVQPEDIQAALTSPVEDFEDALVDAVAKRYNAICTLTRNARDFKGAKVTAMEPGEYIRKFFAE